MRNIVYDFYFESPWKAPRQRRAARTRKVRWVDKAYHDEDADSGSGKDDDAEDDGLDDEDSEDGSSEKDDDSASEVSDHGDAEDHDSEDDDDETDEDDADEHATAPPSGRRFRKPIPGSYYEMKNKIRLSTRYPDEFVIDQRGDPLTISPRLICASRQLLAETWRFSFQPGCKFGVHVNVFNVRLFATDGGILSVLDDICGVNIPTEANTTVVLHFVNLHRLDKRNDNLR